MPDALCFAVESDVGPIQWRCNQQSGHYPDTAHAYTARGKTHHSWTDAE